MNNHQRQVDCLKEVALSNQSDHKRSTMASVVRVCGDLNDATDHGSSYSFLCGFSRKAGSAYSNHSHFIRSELRFLGSRLLFISARSIAVTEMIFQLIDP